MKGLGDMQTGLLDVVKEKLTYSPETGLFHWKNGKQAGCKRRDGYLVIRVDGVLYYAHRLAWLMATGEAPKFVIDHINGQKTDNRICNLRDATRAQNAQNLKGAHSDSRSGLLGVQRNHSGWQAVIWRNGARMCLGTFRTKEQASDTYRAKAKELAE